jgi:hypothetical protein
VLYAADGQGTSPLLTRFYLKETTKKGDLMNIYNLSRAWFNFSFENPEIVKPNHTALYFFIIEHCNRLGWKEKFGLPSTMAMEAVGIKSYNTYITTLNDLISFGFVNLIQKSKNQYSSNIVAISNFDKAHDKALDKALIKHASKQSESTIQSIDSINKQYYNNTNSQINKLDYAELIQSGNFLFFLEENNLQIIALVKNTEALPEQKPKHLQNSKIKKEITTPEILDLISYSKNYFDEKYIAGSEKIFDELIRIDQYKPEEMKKAIRQGKEDVFWTKNFLTPKKLRSKDKNGVLFIDIFLKLTPVPTQAQNGSIADKKYASGMKNSSFD